MRERDRVDKAIRAWDNTLRTRYNITSSVMKKESERERERKTEAAA